MITGLDLVEWQLEVRKLVTPRYLSSRSAGQVAAGNPLPLTQSEIPMVGHAFEARIYAENPRNDFLPDSGRLVHISTPASTHIFAPQASAVPTAPAVRVEQGFGTGAQIGVFYDPMIAKLVVHGADRTEALRALRVALEDYHVVGVSTNIAFLRALAGHPAFIAAEVDTGFIPVLSPSFLIELVFNELHAEAPRPAATASRRATRRAPSPSSALPSPARPTALTTQRNTLGPPIRSALRRRHTHTQYPARNRDGHQRLGAHLHAPEHEQRRSSIIRHHDADCALPRRVGRARRPDIAHRDSRRRTDAHDGRRAATWRSWCRAAAHFLWITCYDGAPARAGVG